MNKILCIGAGSIGQKHSEILTEMGHKVVFRDKIAARNTEIDMDYVYDAALICTPAGVRDIVPMYRGAAPLFVEKPMGKVPQGVNIQVGFCYYWLPSLAKYVHSLSYERIYSLTLIAGQKIEEWHTEPYQHRTHGIPGKGGVVLDSLPHSLFIARWILGEMNVVGSVTGHLSGLDIGTEDVAAVLLKSAGGIPCYCQVDYLREPREFEIQAVTTNGVMKWKFDVDEAHEMYVNQMAAFCRLVEGKDQYPRPNWHDGEAVDDLLAAVRYRPNQPIIPGVADWVYSDDEMEI